MSECEECGACIAVHDATAIEEAWGIDLRQESGETRRLFARDAARIITVVQEWGRES